MRLPLAVFALVNQRLPTLVANMTDDAERSESPSDGFDLHEACEHLRASVQELAIEFRFLKAEVARLKQHLQHLAQFEIAERNKRNEALASRDRLLRTFMNRLSTAIDEFNSQLNAVEVHPEREPDE